MEASPTYKLLNWLFKSPIFYCEQIMSHLRKAFNMTLKTKKKVYLRETIQEEENYL